MADVTNSLNPSLCSNIKEKFQLQLMKLAIGSIQQLFIERNVIDNIKLENSVSDSDFYDLIGMYTTIVKLFMQSDKQEFEEKLISCGFTQQFIDKLPLKYENRDAVLSTAQSADAKNETNLQFKIDISLTNNVLKRVVPPWVIITLCNDNRNITFSVDIGTFHKLRFNVALLLKELNKLKNSNIMKK